MTDSNTFLSEEYTIDTPENVTFGYEVAGIGSRFIGALIDSVLLVVVLGLLNILVLVIVELVGGVESIATIFFDTNDLNWVVGLVLAFYALLNFVLLWGYYVIFEWLWNGQTPGKRVAKVRVVRMDGNPAGFLEIIVRNLVRMIDFLPSGYGVGLIVMFFNQRARRLGDYAAGTLVVKERIGISLESLQYKRTQSTLVNIDAATDALLVRYANIRRLSADDYDLIQETLARYGQRNANTPALQRLAQVIATKLETPPPNRDLNACHYFLREVAEAYRRLGAG